MPESIKGLNAVITGASSGIGEAIATRLAKEGANIALLARNVEKMSQMAQKLQDQYHVAVHVIKLDLAQKESVDAAAKQVVSHFSTVHILINNSGISNKIGSVMESDPDKWEQVMLVNLVNTMRLTRQLLAPMKQSAVGAAIVFTSSIAARSTFKGNADYCASKHGINGFAGSLFEDVREFGIKVTMIMPGFVNTPMLHGEKLDFAKCIQPDDVVQAVLFVITSPDTVCPTEIVLRPQKSPYLK